MREYQPNPRIVNRAVELWVEMLAAPRYDNGDPSPAGFMTAALANIVPKNNEAEILARFGEELRGILSAPLEWEYKNSHSGAVTKHTTLFNSLSVDYGPDTPLATAAERAGLKMEFPWKTSMYLSENHLWLRRGYGGSHEYHYPLSDDRWLVCALSGDDMPKIVALIESGVLTPELVPVNS